MRKKSTSQFAFFNLPVLFFVACCLCGLPFVLFSAAKSTALSGGRPNRIELPSSAGVQEEWVARYDDNSVDDATAIVVDSLGNVYVTGSSFSSGHEIVTIKYNTAGQQQWVARYSGSGNAFATAIAVDSSGRVYVTGYSSTENFGDDYVTIKYNATGQQQWIAQYNGGGNLDDHAVAIVVDVSGNVYVTGFDTNTGFETEYATVKYNAAGQQEWAARYHGPNNSFDFASALAVDPSGNVYVTGQSLGSNTSDDYATIKYNAAGQEQWVARYNGPANDSDGADAVAIDGAGNVYVTGASWGSGTDVDYATIKYNSNGQVQWVQRYDGPSSSYDAATALKVDGAGNVYVTGFSATSESYYDYATIKYSAAGQQQWVARYNGPPGNDIDEAAAIAVDGSGSVYVTGRSIGSGTYFDYATVKYNSSGQEDWVVRYNGPANADDSAAGIAVDDSGNVYVTGSSYVNGNDDYATIKYVQGPTPTPTPCTGRCAPTPRPRPTSHPRLTAP
jgi:uncharacterized delta-60 repeat protein